MSLTEATTIVIAEFSEIFGSIAIDFVPGEIVSIDSNLLAQRVLGADYGLLSLQSDGDPGTFLCQDISANSVARQGFSSLSRGYMVATQFICLPDSGARGLTRSVATIVVSSDRNALINQMDIIAHRLSTASRLLLDGAVSTYLSDASRLVPSLLLTISLVLRVISHQEESMCSVEEAIDSIVHLCDVEEEWRTGAAFALKLLFESERDSSTLLEKMRAALRTYAYRIDGHPLCASLVELALNGQPFESLREMMTNCSGMPLSEIPGRVSRLAGKGLRPISTITGDHYDRFIDSLSQLHQILARPPRIGFLEDILALDLVGESRDADNPDPVTIGSCVAGSRGFTSLPTRLAVTQRGSLEPQEWTSPSLSTITPLASQAASLYVTRLGVSLLSSLHSVLYEAGDFARFSDDMSTDAESTPRLPAGTDTLSDLETAHVIENQSSQTTLTPIQRIMRASSAANKALPSASIHTLTALSASALWPSLVASLFSTSATVLAGPDRSVLTRISEALSLISPHIMVIDITSAADAEAVLANLSPQQYAIPILITMVCSPRLPSQQTALSPRIPLTPRRLTLLRGSSRPAGGDFPSLAKDFPVTVNGRCINVIDFELMEAAMRGPTHIGPLLDRLCKPVTSFVSALAWFAYIQAGITHMVNTAATFSYLIKNGTTIIDAALQLEAVENSRNSAKKVLLTPDILALCLLSGLSSADIPEDRVHFPKPIGLRFSLPSYF